MKIPGWFINGAIVLGALALRDAVAASLKAYADYKVKKAAATPDLEDDRVAAAQAAVLHAVADRISAADPESADELRKVAGPVPPVSPLA